MRSRSWRRHHNERIIRKRVRTAKNIWEYKDPISLIPGGMFRKYNFTCDCQACKVEGKLNSLDKQRRQLARSVQESDYID